MANGETQQSVPAQTPRKPVEAGPLAKIKATVLSEDSFKHFMTCLPSAKGKHAKEVAERFAKMVYTVICQSTDLQKCSVASILRAASTAATLDLDIDVRGLAYLVPYKNEAQFQIGYQGLIELAYRSGKVKSIAAHCIYESEREKIRIVRTNGQYTVEHPFSFDPPTGKIIAVYATAEVEGIGPQTCVLRIDEIEKLHQMSKCPGSPAWKNHYEAMCKKTAVRQLAKFLPKSILDDFTRVAAEDEQRDFGQAATAAAGLITGEAGSQAIDTHFEEPANQQPETPEPQGEDFLKD
jgi:recombination protein RecT